jgi:hypothetical protein
VEAGRNRMLERLGFSPAKAEAHATHQVEPDEGLMFQGRHRNRVNL